MRYIVRYYDPVGMVIKEEYLTPHTATERWLELVALGHKSVKLTTQNRSY